MRNIYDVLRQKEAEIQQLQRDIEALRVAARLLADDSDPSLDSFSRSSAGAPVVAAASGMRPAPPPAPATVAKGGEVAYSAARENSLRQFP
jgi:hypothetical protein